MQTFVIRSLKWILTIILGLGLILSGLGLGYRTLQQRSIQPAIRIDSPEGVQSLEQVELGGINQWIKIRGHNRQNPILLFLHGGPGMTELPVSHLFDTELEQHFTVVHWDQRASGKTRREGFIEAELTIPVFLQDTLELVNHLRARFNKDKIYLVGHSWGSMLGTLMVRDHPELFHAYVGMGQLVNLTDNEKVSLEYVRQQAKEDGNEEVIAQIKEFVPPYTEDPKQLGIQRQWLYYYGGGYRGITPAMLLKAYLTSPDYSVLDLLALTAGAASVATHMWPEMAGYDFRIDAIKLEVPVYFFTGRHDYNTPWELTVQYYEILDAPHKEIVWFENSAHFMNVSDPRHYQDMLINKVLKKPQTAIPQMTERE